MDKIKEKYKLQKDLLFQQDKAKLNKCRKSLEAIEVIFGINKTWWPANSPDLSSIEIEWSIQTRINEKEKYKFGWIAK